MSNKSAKFRSRDIKCSVGCVVVVRGCGAEVPLYTFAVAMKTRLWRRRSLIGRKPLSVAKDIPKGSAQRGKIIEETNCKNFKWIARVLEPTSNFIHVHVLCILNLVRMSRDLVSVLAWNASDGFENTPGYLFFTFVSITCAIAILKSWLGF